METYDKFGWCSEVPIVFLASFIIWLAAMIFVREKDLSAVFGWRLYLAFAGMAAFFIGIFGSLIAKGICCRGPCC